MADEPPSGPPGQLVRIGKALYGGDSLGHTPTGEPVRLPFVLPGELVELGGHDSGSEAAALRILEPSPERTEPHCLHFGACGGCQYQMAAYPAQVAAKERILRDLLAQAGLAEIPAIAILASPEPFGYRNRIRLRLRRIQGELQCGYNVRGMNEFLPIRMCPIAAPLLPRAAAALLTAAQTSRETARVLDTADELELFCGPGEARLQATLLCPGKAALEPRIFAKAMEAWGGLCPELTGAGAVRTDPRTGRALGSIAGWGAPGLPYAVGNETYWITRGGFFQVNRSLLPQLVDRVCAERSGEVAWDLFAGVGLFSRVLARHFAAVTAVESHPAAGEDLARALAKLGPGHRAVSGTTLEFLRRAVLERERPELIVLDPPRAGAGEEACRLLARLAPAEIVYLSCDPTTLARDLAVLTASGYAVAELQLIDLFPQTLHIETLAVLRRRVAD